MNRSKISQFLLTMMVFLLMATSLHAQSGCTDSPEAPTDVLLLVGAVGLTKGSAIVKWLRQRR